ncbi:MAG: hypothetical protein GOP50_10615 [Candidatus Heimdallarchaeota archaeon]|nr:hypothetical protein [Candidatus Heimdallarchaeota archaeon]
MVTKYPLFILCGRDEKKRELIKTLDPDEKYGVKCLIPMLGKRVIDWQLEELRKSPYVDEIYLLGLTEDMAKFDYPVHYVPVPTVSNLAEKLYAGLQYLRKQGKTDTIVSVSSSDTPGMTVEAINNFYEQADKYRDYDYVQSVVTDKVTAETFPSHKRVVVKFIDHHVYPGEMYLMSEHGITEGKKLIAEITGGRTKIKKRNREKKNSPLIPLLRIIITTPRIWPSIFKFLFGRLTLAGAEKAFSIISKGMKITTVIVEDAGFGMDMDLSEDYEVLKKYMSEITGIPYTEGIS